MLCLHTSVVRWDGQEMQRLVLMQQETFIRIITLVAHQMQETLLVSTHLRVFGAMSFIN